MNKIKLFIATTLDGYIAREDGSLDWLNELPNPNQIDHGYNDFYSTIDVVVIGRKTYEEILGFGVDWPYSSNKTYIVTSKKGYQVQTENTEVIHQIDTNSILKIKENSKKNIWIVGGGEIITAFLNHNSIDEMILCMIPIILSKGIKLFPNNPKETKFELIKSEKFDTGIINLTYLKKAP